ncbi:MAG: Xaa-Pro peptidase family protein [Candidatus Zixiibacteriota bacterium]
MKVRINKIQKKIKQENLDAFLVTTRTNVRYLSGYSGSNGLLLITPAKSFFLTDFRYWEQAKKQVKGSKIIFGERDLIDDLPKLDVLKPRRIKLGFESENISFTLYQRLEKLLPETLLVPTEKFVESLVMIKDIEELKIIKRAVQITDRVFSQILNFIQPGITEQDLAAEIEYMMKKDGAEGPAFDTIVASGFRSALPHGRASQKKIKKGEFVTFDMGALVDGYCADMTRTVVVGKATPKQKKVYQLVLRAQKKAINSARPGMRCDKLDKVARDVIKKAGFGKYFGHGLGHGIGLLVHDLPRLTSKSSEVLMPGMVVTIEPGVYIPKWGGVRIEDDVIITKKGCEVLNRSPKNLLEI